MMLYRYMSQQEFDKYLDGQRIEPIRTFEHYRTTSSGICFLAETVVGYSDYKNEKRTWTPEQAFTFLLGLVSEDIFAVFRIDRDKLPKDFLKPTFGVYNDIDYKGSIDDDITVQIREFCMPYYDDSICKLVKYCKPQINSIWDWVEV